MTLSATEVVFCSPVDTASDLKRATRKMAITPTWPSPGILANVILLKTCCCGELALRFSSASRRGSVATMRVRHPSSIVDVAFYKPASFRRSVMAAALFACYAIVLYFVYDTMGDPHRAALAELEVIKEKYPEKYGAASIKKAKAKKKADKFGAIMHDRQSLFADDDEDEFDEDSPLSGDEDLDDGKGENDAEATAIHTNSKSNSSKNGTDYEDLPPMPPWYLPNAFSSASLFLLMSSHALFYFLCHWMVWFKAKALFDPLESVDEIRPGGTYAMVVPQPHRGKPAMTIIERLKYTDSFAFTFQKQVYLYEKPHDGADNGCVTLATPAQLTVAQHLRSTGLDDETVIRTNTELFGKNSLLLATPSFMTLYKQQLLSPIAIFQFFTSILWLMDEYWQYTLFSLFNVLMFESTTTFQRLKTMKTLNSMSSKPYFVFVYRYGKWTQMSTAELLPGDLLSLKRTTGKAKPGVRQLNPAGATDVIPCDCVLLNGSAVVNEATLTGESVPQMKEALKPASDPATKLEMSRQHRVHVLFSGTTLISSRRDASQPRANRQVPPTPDDGCLAMALRTGFNSSQGELVQMIEFSQQKVSGDSKETLMALGILLVFALVAAAYVLKKGIEKGDRTTHQLLLKSVIIITSVVPQQLPMQMAMAVNTALLNLTRNGIFCTEPYRVPYAGKVDHCLFDKTGTLTTDKLVPVGVVSVQPRPGETRMLDGSRQATVKTVARDGNAVEVKLENGNLLKLQSAETLHPVQSRKGLLPVNQASEAAALVLAGCHSLVDVEGVGLIGDPIELAGLQGVQWHYDASEQKAIPDFGRRAADRAMRANQKIAEDAESTPKQRKDAKAKSQNFSAVMLSASRKIKNSAIKNVRILQRHHFASKLQRMSVVCNVVAPDRPDLHGQCCLVKGSPEAVGALLRAQSRPEWYDSMYTRLAELGMRVLALAYKQSCDATKLSRELVESDLHFAGFIAFECKTRADSAMVMRALMDSNHQVTMVTGDAPLTANYVAQQVNISSKKSSLLLRVGGGATDEGKEEPTAFWVPADLSARNSMPEPLAFDVNQVRALAEKHDLIVTEEGVDVITALSGGEAMKHMDCIRVFSRMSPHGKATVIRALQKHQGLHVLMCGDGGNDVGALKQAEVGLALLSGYGDSNTDDAGDKEDDRDGKDAEDKLNAKVQNLKKKGQRARLLMSKELQAKRKELTSKQAEWIQEDLRKNNQSGVWATVQATTRCAKRMQMELRNEQRRLAKKYDVYASKDGKEEALDSAMESMVPVVRPGDASVAAPFTTRVPSVVSVVDLIRQGRCTLLSALQQQQIMMLQCIVSAYTLSALNLNGARSSERQMMASGWLIMIASIAFSYSKPVQKMHPVRPLKSLFHPAIIISIALQAVIHLYAMITAVNMAKEAMGEELLQEVIDFHRKNDRAAAAAALEYEELDADVVDEDPFAEFWSIWSTPFKPNLMNTVVFLVETAQIIAILFVNYKGRPWMKGVTENHALFLSVFFCVLGVAICAWGVFPQVNAMIHLEPFPDDAFRWKIMRLVGLSIVGTFVVDRVVTALFAPHIFKIMLQQARATNLADLGPPALTFGKACGVLALLAFGNILVWGGLAWWWWRRRKAAQAELIASGS